MHKTKQFCQTLRKVLPFALPAVLLIAWEWGSAAGAWSPVYFPGPSRILARSAHLFLDGDVFSSHILFSLRRVLIASLIAIPPAVLLGLAMGLNRTIHAVINPLIATTYPLPKLAVFPLFMIFFGIGDASRIALIALSEFYLVLLTVFHGARDLPRSYYDIAAVYHIPPLRLFALFLKAVLPDILNGCKIGISFGLVMMVAGELVAAQNGIGFFMWNAWDQFRVIDLYVSLLVLSLLGVAVFRLFDALLARIPWTSGKNADREHS